MAIRIVVAIWMRAESAAELAAALTDDSAGGGKARLIETKSTDSNAHFTLRVEGPPPQVKKKGPAVRPRMQQSLDKADALYNAKRYREAERLFGKLLRNLDKGTIFVVHSVVIMSTNINIDLTDLFNAFISIFHYVTVF